MLFYLLSVADHSADYTPVCTTELGAFAKLEPEFTKRNCKLIGLSANTVDSQYVSYASS